MKKVLINARKEDYADLASILEDHHHVVLRQDPVYEVKVFLPDNDLDAFIEEVRETVDLRYRENLIEVSSPEFVISPYLTRAEEKAEKTEKIERTPIEKLIETTRPYLRLNTGTLAMTSIAGLIALTGLFLNNVTVIIGAMLLSPILGPIYAFAISVAVGRGKDGVRSLSVLAALLLSVFVLSALTTAGLNLLVPLTVTPEILSRTVVSPIYILMAVLLGFAAVLALDRGMSDLIAGVAIAAALLPPTVVAGIATILLTDRVLQAGVLVLENVVGMLAGALIATLVLGIGAREYYEQVAARKAMVRTALAVAVLLAILLGLSLALT